MTGESVKGPADIFCARLLFSVFGHASYLPKNVQEAEHYFSEAIRNL